MINALMLILSKTDVNQRPWHQTYAYGLHLRCICNVFGTLWSLTILVYCDLKELFGFKFVAFSKFVAENVIYPPYTHVADDVLLSLTMVVLQKYERMSVFRPQE